jgi:hypothetical protein
MVEKTDTVDRVDLVEYTVSASLSWKDDRAWASLGWWWVVLVVLLVAGAAPSVTLSIASSVSAGDPGMVKELRTSWMSDLLLCNRRLAMSCRGERTCMSRDGDNEETLLDMIPVFGGAAQSLLLLAPSFASSPDTRMGLTSPNEPLLCADHGDGTVARKPLNLGSGIA